MWKIEWDLRAEKDLRKCDKPTQKRITQYIEKVVAENNPRQRGSALSHNKSGLWRYRVGDYRLICQIEDSYFIVLVIACGHRKEIYDH